MAWGVDRRLRGLKIDVGKEVLVVVRSKQRTGGRLQAMGGVMKARGSSGGRRQEKAWRQESKT